MASNKNIVTVGEFMQRDPKLKNLISSKASTTSSTSKQTTTKNPYVQKNLEYIRNLDLKNKRSLQYTSYENLPAEILYIIFSQLNFDDLITCTEVCKRWSQIANNNVLWSKWVKKYKCFADYENYIKNELDKLSETASQSPSYKNICLNVMRRHSEKNFIKYKQLLLTKISNFTRQVDLKTLLNDPNIISFEAIFYDKSMNRVYSNNKYKLVTFDMSASICWSNFDDLESIEILKQIEYFRIYAKVSLFLQINNKVLKPFSNISNNKSNSITKRTLIYEYKLNVRNFDNQSNEVLFSNSMIKLYFCDKNLIAGLWNTNDNVKNFAFMTYNLVYTDDLVIKMFSFDYETEVNKMKMAKHKNNVRDLELDSKFGLHDYFVYLCFRNQTSSVFLSHNIDIFKASIEYCKVFKKKCLVLNVIDSDNEHSVGPQLTNLPKFFWNTEAFKKNAIDLLTIIDLCVQDSNKKSLISTSFPVFFKSLANENTNENNNNNENIETTFIAAEFYTFSSTNKNFHLSAQVNCLKDEFTYSSKLEAYHLANMKISLPLDFINEWFDTKFT